MVKMSKLHTTDIFAVQSVKTRIWKKITKITHTHQMPFARDLCTLINTKSCFVQRLCNDKKTTQGFIAILDTKHSHCMLLAFPKCKALSFYLVEPLYKASYKNSQFFCSRKQSLQNIWEVLFKTLFKDSAG